MHFLKSSFLWIILFLSLALWGYAQTQKGTACEVPISYTLGTVNDGFNISRADFLKEAELATHVWENAVGKDLFRVVETKKPLSEESFPQSIPRYFDEYVGRYFKRQPVVLNLIYDERQQRSEQQRVIVAAIDETRKPLEDMKQGLADLRGRYERMNQEYQVLVNEYKNRRGDWDVLENKRLEVNRLADEINSHTRRYNELVRSLNTTINTANQTAGYEFEEGQYVADARGEWINIYEFGERIELRRVLAHEFGHALGLDHNANEDSIMYYLNQSKNLAPTAEDIEGLEAICKGA